MRIFLIFNFCLLTVLSGAGCEKKSAELGQGQKRAPRQAAVLSAASEEVFFRSAKGRDWHPASTGYRLVPGDAISTGQNSRAEVQTRGPASLIRVGENAAFALEQSEGAGMRTMGVRLLKGGVWGSVKKLEAGEEFEFHGPALASAREPATFRMEIQGDSSASVSVYEGTVQVQRPLPGSGKLDIQTLTRGEQLLLPATGPSRKLSLPAHDPWRKGWKPRQEVIEEEPDTGFIPRIEEKPRRRGEGEKR